MKKTWLIVAALGLAAASQAVLTEDFDGYNLGRLNELNGTTANPGSGWLGTSELTSTGNGLVIVDPIDGGTDQALALWGAGSAGRGLYKNLGADTITDGDWAVLSFDFMTTTSNQSPQVYFGLATDLGVDGVISPFGDYEAFIGINGAGKDLIARDGSNTVVLVSGGFADLGWHTIEMLIMSGTDKYQVSFDGNVVSGFLSFRQNSGEDAVEIKDLEAIAMYSQNGGNSTSDYAALDNVNLTIIPEPGTLGLMAAGAGLLFWRRRKAM